MGRKSKFSDAQIIGFIKEIEGGATGTSIARREGVSLETMSRWRAKFGGMSVSDAQEKRRLEEENRKLRGLVAQYALDNESLKAALGKKWR
jgi:putative transposase